MHQSNRETQGGGGPADVFSQVGDELGQSLRREFERLRDEAGDRARAAARGAGLLTAAGFSGGVAVTAAGMLPLLALRRIIGPAGTSVVVAAGAGAVAAYLAKRGLDELGVPTAQAAERAKAAAQEAFGG